MTKLQDAALEQLKLRIERAGSQKAAADELGVSPSDITNALKGYRPMTESMLNALGFRTVSVAVPVEQAEQMIKELQEQSGSKKNAAAAEAVAA